MLLQSTFYRPVFLSWLLLITAEDPLAVRGQGVTLHLNGVTLPNDSFVDFDDIRRESDNANRFTGYINCSTDLEACCHRNQRNLSEGLGYWYYPDGSRVIYETNGQTYSRSRSQSNVHLFRRGSSSPPERGRFHCVVPNAQNVNQTVYVNILNISPVTIIAFGFPEKSFSLVCFATVETQNDSPTPNFDWFFGPNNDSVPSGATLMSTITGNDNTYTSILHFSQLQESHAGKYTCRLGSNARLAVSAIVTVKPTFDTGTSSSSSSCSSEVGIAVGVTILLECLAVAVISITVVLLCWKRKKSSSKTKFVVSANIAYGKAKLESQGGGGKGTVYEYPEKMVRSRQGNGRQTEIAVSTNLAYGEVKLESQGGGGNGSVYEDPEKMVTLRSEQGNDRQTETSANHEHNMDEPTETNEAKEPEYASVDEIFVGQCK